MQIYENNCKNIDEASLEGAWYKLLDIYTCAVIYDFATTATRFDLLDTYQQLWALLGRLNIPAMI